MPTALDPLATLAGFGFGLSLIVAIGAQNAFVLRQGLLRRHVFAVVAICALSDALLIAIGISGVGLAIDRVPVLMTVVRIGGAAFLTVYGILAARRALRPSALAPEADRTFAGLGATILTCLALTWLNPHVYLDTIVLLGSVANSHGDARWLFGLGAGIASIVWFAALGYGARLLRPVFARPLAWRILDGIIALVMFAIAVSLILGI
ncbi:LysE/ArgO family amino acid transporter [Herbiconiux sp. CPCC 205763]|uniref:LysE/ArgO family amino acid transporter n=1 Tax=Herbiconiux aconitum TaxID=2970913 RepID=A0ABT2GRW5_9MICO|nr:LysE/ArgO family amino acid transporter [Herbiconiux aconitum]MCS5718962.1 LysE/ArgO family amino acid transporter [Herbiconiux aconitum]